MITWIMSALSIIGAVLNAKGKVSGFYFWIVANLAWVAYDISIGLYSQAVLFAVYTVISAWGIYQWRKAWHK